MKRHMTVTVGIPAFNEEANILSLISSLLKQKKDKFRLKEILISSDGSEDKTVDLIKGIKSPIVRVIDNKSRKGQAERQNQIIKQTDSDVLVLLNADILIKDKNFLEKLILPIIKNKADLTSARIVELIPRKFLEKVLAVSMDFKRVMFESFNKGNNIYTCHGRARGFSRRLYKKIRFKDSVGEDAYSYLYCYKSGFPYTYVKSAEVYYKLPDNFADHKKQSIRFLKSQNELFEEFGGMVNKSYKLPKKAIVKGLIIYTFKNPIKLFIYLIILNLMRLKAKFEEKTSNTWEISTSSKKLTYE